MSKSLILSFILILTILCCFTTSEFSSIDTTVAYIQGQDQTRSYFRGRLWCEEGCSQSDKFSFIAGITTGTSFYEVHSIEITFFDEETGDILIKLDQEAKFLQFQTTSNRVDDKIIPWIESIAPGKYVGFRGSIKFNWISKESERFLDNAIITYLPSSQFVMPQNIIFEQRFSFSASDYGYIDGIWSSKDANEGRFSAIIDGIKADVHGVQIKLIGMTWITDSKRGCDINGVPVYSLILDEQRNTMTFISPKKFIPIGTDVIVSCLEPMIKPLQYSIIDVTHSTQQSYAEVRLLEGDVDHQDPNHFYTHIHVHSLFNVIDSTVPELRAHAAIKGNVLICEFDYSLPNQTIPLINKDFFHFSVVNYPRTAGEAIVRVTPTDRPDVTLQRINKLTASKNVYNRSPVALTLPKDGSFPESSLKSITFTTFIPLDDQNIESSGVFCRFNLLHPNQQDQEFVYSTTYHAPINPLAATKMILPKWSQPINNTATTFSIELSKPKSKYNNIIIETTTYDFMFTGIVSTCVVTKASTVEEKLLSDNTSTNTKTTIVYTTPTDFAEDTIIRQPRFSLLLNEPITPDAASITITCPDLYYATQPTETSNDVLKAPNSIIFTGYYLDTKQEDAPIRYSYGIKTPPFTPKSKTPKTAIIILVTILVVLLILFAGFIFFRRFQANRRKNEEQLHQILVEEETTLVIQ